MKHKKVIQQWYEIDFNATHRTLGGKIDTFLEGAPQLDSDKDAAAEMWDNNITILRDFDGDFDGILIYHNDDTAASIKFICEKIGIDYSDVKDLNFKLVG